MGGALEIVHRPGDEGVRRLDTDLDRLGAALIVAYSGQSHLSAATNWQVIRRRLEGDAETVERFARIARVTAGMPAALEAGELAEVGEHGVGQLTSTAARSSGRSTQSETISTSSCFSSGGAADGSRR